MEQFLQYTILGLVIGGVYGIAASGLVVTYTTSGIFNFAHGAIAMLAAFTYWQLRFGWGWPAPLALLVVLGVLAPLLGALLYRVVMRGLRGTSEVTKIVVPVERDARVPGPRTCGSGTRRPARRGCSCMFFGAPTR